VGITTYAWIEVVQALTSVTQRPSLLPDVFAWVNATQDHEWVWGCAFMQVAWDDEREGENPVSREPQRPG